MQQWTYVWEMVSGFQSIYKLWVQSTFTVLIDFQFMTANLHNFLSMQHIKFHTDCCYMQIVPNFFRTAQQCECCHKHLNSKLKLPLYHYICHFSASVVIDVVFFIVVDVVVFTCHHITTLVVTMPQRRCGNCIHHRCHHCL